MSFFQIKFKAKPILYFVLLQSFILQWAIFLKDNKKVHCLKLQNEKSLKQIMVRQKLP